MPHCDQAIYDRVHAVVTACFELDGFTFGPNTDLVSISRQRGDSEPLEDALVAIEREFKLAPPLARDAPGRTRRRRIRTANTVTLADLCAIAEAGAWPTEWIQDKPVFDWWGLFQQKTSRKREVR